MTTLPTIEQAREFLRVINVGREAIGLEPLDKLDFEGADPGDSGNCLSARNLFAHVDAYVGGEILDYIPYALATAIGAARASTWPTRYVIPSSIRVVTDPFDREEDGLYERLVEAGVV